MEQAFEVEADANGTLVLSSEITGIAKPHARFIIERGNGHVTLTPKEEVNPFWATATPEERAADFRQWIANLRKQVPPHSPLPDEALRRENMYD